MKGSFDPEGRHPHVEKHCFRTTLILFPSRSGLPYLQSLAEVNSSSCSTTSPQVPPHSGLKCPVSSALKDLKAPDHSFLGTNLFSFPSPTPPSPFLLLCPPPPHTHTLFFPFSKIGHPQPNLASENYDLAFSTGTFTFFSPSQ